MNRLASTEREERLSSYLTAYVERSGSVVRFVGKHPGRSFNALRDLFGLQTVRVGLSESVEGRAIRQSVQGTGPAHAVMFGLCSVLQLPRVAADYSVGASKQTLRRKSRAATKLGVTWKKVDATAERRHLLELAERQERGTSREAYRVLRPATRDLLNYRLWLAAYDVEGAPVLLAVTPFDGEAALLRYFRTLSESDAASASRYLT